MAYVTPTTTSTGCLISAACWNQYAVNNITALAASVTQLSTSPLVYNWTSDRIGVNVAAPGFGLDVKAPVNSGALVLGLTGGDTTNNNTQIWFRGANAAAGLFVIGTDVPFGNGQKTFHVYDFTNGLSRLTISASGAALINSSASSGFDTQGLTIQQGAATDEILSFKQSGLGHTVTGLTDANTYGAFLLDTTACGGVVFRGYGNNGNPNFGSAISLQGIRPNSGATTPAAGTFGAINLNGYDVSGGGFAAMAASTFIVSMRNSGSTRFLFRQDGTSYEHVGTAWTNFDEQDDLALLNLTAAHLSRDPVREHFGAWLQTNRQQLQDLNLVVFAGDDGPFVNRSRMQELLVGAVRQMGEKNRLLEERLAQLEEKLARLLTGPPPETT